jgi:hypothetical protein
MSEPRGIIPTYVTDGRLVLAKASPTVRSTYEIRLALYFALKRNSIFTLLVLPNAVIDANLEAHLAKFGGEVRREAVNHFSVSYGAVDPNGEELDTWVLGDQTRWQELSRSLTSSWLIKHLQFGNEFTGDELDTLATEIGEAPITGTNVDGEPLKVAILNLIAAAQKCKGRLVLQ